MMNRKIAALALCLSAMVASGALAHAPGNTVDGDGCEIHASLGDNWCNTGKDGIKIKAQNIFGTPPYAFCMANPVTTAYASLTCDGFTWRGQVDGSFPGNGNLGKCWTCTRAPVRSVCGQKEACQTKG